MDAGAELSPFYSLGPGPWDGTTHSWSCPHSAITPIYKLPHWLVSWVSLDLIKVAIRINHHK